MSHNIRDQYQYIPARTKIPFVSLMICCIMYSMNINAM